MTKQNTRPRPVPTPRPAKSFHHELSIAERVLLEALLPKRATYIDLLTLQKLREEFLPSAEEVAELELRDHPGGGMAWNPIKAQAAGPKKIRFVANAQKVVKNALTVASEAGTLPMELMAVFERFVPEKERTTEE